MKKKGIVTLVHLLLFSLFLISCNPSETKRENQSGKEIIYMYNFSGKYAIVNNMNSLEKKIVSSGFITRYYFDHRHDLYIVTGRESLGGFTFKVKRIDIDTWVESVIEGNFEQPTSLYSDSHYLYVLDATEGINGMLHIYDLNTKKEVYTYSFPGFASLVKKYNNTLFILSDDLETNQHYMYVFEQFNIKDASTPKIFKLNAGLATHLIGNGNEVYIALQSNAEMSGKGNMIAVYHIEKENVTYINLKNPSPYHLTLTENGQLLSANYDFVTRTAFNAERIDLQTKGTEVLDFKTNSIHAVGDKIAYFHAKNKEIIFDGKPVLHTDENIIDFFILP